MANYRPGELDERIIIRRETESDDGGGGVTVAVADYATLWALVRPASGNERLAMDAIQAEATVVFVIRARSDLRESDRIKWRDVEYNIRTMGKRSPRAMYLEITAERGVAQ